MTRLTLALVIFGAGSACSGKTMSEPLQPETSGGSAMGGAAGTGGSTNLGGGGLGGNASSSSACPDARPTTGSACNYVGGQCNYELDACSSVGLDCAAGKWREVPQSDGAALTCSNFTGAELPKDGASCACRGLLDCSIDDCSGSGKVHAVCDNTTWHVTSEVCADTPCGSAGLSCKPSEVCVVPGGRGSAPTCQPDPCAAASETTSCACAASLCGSAEPCSVQGGVIECECPSC